MGKSTTGVTGFLVEGNFGIPVTIFSTGGGSFEAINRNTGTTVDFDPFLSQWITQRAISSAAIRAGYKENFGLVRLNKISAELQKDRNAKLWSTKLFIEKMDPRNAKAILAFFENQAMQIAPAPAAKSAAA